MLNEEELRELKEYVSSSVIFSINSHTNRELGHLPKQNGDIDLEACSQNAEADDMETGEGEALAEVTDQCALDAQVRFYPFVRMSKPFH